jgi:glycerol-3-phosphate cytidylyltransferase
VCSEAERKYVLESCIYVDKVVMNVGGENSKIAIEMVDPNYIVIGSDWAKKDYYKQMGFDQDWLDEKEIGLVYVPYTKDISSTEIKRRLKE